MTFGLPLIWLESLCSSWRQRQRATRALSSLVSLHRRKSFFASTSESESFIFERFDWKSFPKMPTFVRCSFFFLSSLVLFRCSLGSVTDDRPIVFPEEATSAAADAHLGESKTTPIQVPESFLIRMQKSKNISDFLALIEKQFDEKDSSSGKGKPVIIGNGTIDGRRQGYDASILKSVSVAAGCELEQQAIEIERDEDPSVLSFPSCTRLARCGGCCTSSFLACVPVKKSLTDVNVMQVRYKSEDNFDILGVKSFRMEVHEKCRCDCRERVEHCSLEQRYLRGECRCECKNRKAREMCKGSNKIWDSKDCACKCLNEDECSTGLFYNPLTCACEPLRSSRLSSVRARIGGPPMAKSGRAGAPLVKDEGESQSGKHIGIRPSEDTVGLYRMASLQNEQKPYAIPAPSIHEQQKDKKQ